MKTYKVSIQETQPMRGRIVRLKDGSLLCLDCGKKIHENTNSKGGETNGEI